MPPNQTDEIHDGRKQTDKSLSTERDKTDESLSDDRERTERQADRAVADSRTEADATRAQVRRKDRGQTNRQELGEGAAAERLDSEQRVRQERETSDTALGEERRATDAARDRERSQQKATGQRLFHAERGKTDHDLTHERKEADAEVQRVNDVLTVEVSAHGSTRAALTTRDEFLSIVSHDLRNPIASISGAADLLAETPLYAAADEDAREYVDMIARNASEALRLINDLMDMEQIAIGKLGLELELCDVREVVRHSIKALTPLSLAKGLDLRVEANTSASVRCDRGRISQVLSNLIGNALKFTPSGGVITVTVRAKTAESQISVSDTGPGIPGEMRKTVFERFGQIGKHDRRGLGLGLYISTVIVEAHGGRIWLDSEVGRGSTFHFTLPRGERTG